MAQPIHSILTDIEIAEISQYLSINKNSVGKIFRGGNLDERLPVMLYMERKALQWINGVNPNDGSIVYVGNYVYALCGPYQNQAQQILGSSPCISPSILVQPVSQTITQGSNVTFSVVATGTGVLTYQWLKNGSSIGGATSSLYTITGIQPTDAANYSVTVSNACGMTTSLSATLTVNVLPITGFWSYGDTDPNASLLAHTDPFTYQESYPITHNLPISAPILLAGSNNKFSIFKVPSGESAKTIWFSTPSNNGIIPDPVFRDSVTFGGFTYYYTRNASSFDPTVSLILS